MQVLHFKSLSVTRILSSSSSTTNSCTNKDSIFKFINHKFLHYQGFYLQVHQPQIPALQSLYVRRILSSSLSPPSSRTRGLTHPAQRSLQLISHMVCLHPQSCAANASSPQVRPAYWPRCTCIQWKLHVNSFLETVSKAWDNNTLLWIQTNKSAVFVLFWSIRKTELH